MLLRWMLFAFFGAMILSRSVVAQDSDEIKIRHALAIKFPKMAVESVVKLPLDSLYEVILNGEVIYTNLQVSYMLGGGALYDLRGTKPHNITEVTTQKLVAKQLSSSEESAIKTVRGTGKRVLYTFEDPNCGYCRQLYKELAKMTDVTVYTFLIPILSPDSTVKSTAVWCSKDRNKAWEQMMTKGVLAQTPKSCSTPLAKNSALAERLSVHGTPAVYLPNGKQLGGFVTVAEVEEALRNK